jgi:hypothetical protein
LISRRLQLNYEMRANGSLIGNTDMSGRFMRAAMTVTAAGLGLLGPSMAAGAAGPCDRACLIGIADRYLAAVVAHKPGKAPLARSMVFVENVKRMKPGEGLWKTATGGPTNFRIYVPDAALQQVGWIGMVQQAGKPMMLALRLKVSNGKITEAEHILVAPEGTDVRNVETPRPALLHEVAPDERLTHDRLVAIGASYYDALDTNDGSKAPFAADCQRRENGVTMAGAGAAPPRVKDNNPSPIAQDCKGQIDSGAFRFIKTIDNRRVIAADPVTGLVMGLSQYRHPFDNLPFTVKHVDGTTSERNLHNMAFQPFDMPAAHIFKIGPEGRIHEIEAIGLVAPSRSPTGWEGVSGYTSTWTHVH